MTHRFFTLFLVFLALGVLGQAFAADAPKKLPRFASLKSDEIFVRTGPAQQYPIRWVYRKRGLPVEIIKEYDTWRQVRDMDGSTGWVHQAMLSAYRTAIIKAKSGVTLTEKPEAAAGAVVRLEKGVVVTIDTCEPSWCRVSLSGFKGWVPRPALWGVYPDETVR